MPLQLETNSARCHALSWLSACVVHAIGTRCSVTTDLPLKLKKKKKSGRGECRYCLTRCVACSPACSATRSSVDCRATHLSARPADHPARAVLRAGAGWQAGARLLLYFCPLRLINADDFIPISAPSSSCSPSPQRSRIIFSSLTMSTRLYAQTLFTWKYGRSKWC